MKKIKTVNLDMSIMSMMIEFVLRTRMVKKLRMNVNMTVIITVYIKNPVMVWKHGMTMIKKVN